MATELKQEGSNINGEQRRYRTDFIDPLFAVAIHVGFTHGIMLESWFFSLKLSSSTDIFNLFSFLLCFSTLVASWFGYHQSIKSKQLKGGFRFVVDILLVVLYMIMMVQFKNFSTILLLQVFVFLFYFAWDLVKIMEHRDLYSLSPTQKWRDFIDKYQREIGTFYWTLIIISIYVLHNFIQNRDGLFLVVSFFALFLFRLDKDHKLGYRLVTWFRSISVGW